MITPIGQRQILQTASAEAVRAAHEGGEQVQREIARRQVLDQRLAEDQGSVRQVASTDGLRLEENPQDRRRDQPEARDREAGPDAGEEPGPRAAPADSHLDFLA